jgi:hypothetical protein
MSVCDTQCKGGRIYRYVKALGRHMGETGWTCMKVITNMAQLNAQTQLFMYCKGIVFG